MNTKVVDGDVPVIESKSSPIDWLPGKASLLLPNRIDSCRTFSKVERRNQNAQQKREQIKRSVVQEKEVIDVLENNY